MAQIKDGLYWVGVLDPQLRVFDIIMHTQYGTSYNAYLIKGTEKIAVSESVKEGFFDEYLQKISALVDPREIDYIIVNHTEPDHSGSVAELLKIAPKATVLGSAAALKFLKEIINTDFSGQEIKDGDRIDLGGKSLNFIAAPFLHWPDSIYTYIPEEQALISGDCFGAHYATKEIFNDAIEADMLCKEDFLSAYAYYYQMIMSPFQAYVGKALAKIQDLPIDIICPSHGPVLRKNIATYLDLYRQWSTVKIDGKLRVTIAYVSAYGYTAQMAKQIAAGIQQDGPIQVYLYDLVQHDFSEVLQKISYSQGILFGSPTINRDALKPIWDLISHLNPIVHGKKIATAFGSYGWSGEAVSLLEARMKGLKLQVLPGLKANFKPSPSELEKAYEFGIAFRRALKQ